MFLKTSSKFKHSFYLQQQKNYMSLYIFNFIPHLLQKMAKIQTYCVKLWKIIYWKWMSMAFLLLWLSTNMFYLNPFYKLVTPVCWLQPRLSVASFSVRICSFTEVKNHLSCFVLWYYLIYLFARDHVIVS